MASIKKVKGGYFVRVSKKEGGKRKFINKKIRGSLQDAQKYARTKESLLDLGHSVEEITQTFETYFAKWLVANLKKVAPGTYNQYKTLPVRYIPEELWRMNLSEIRPHHLQDVYDAVSKKGLDASVAKLHSYLRIFFRYAVKKGVLRKNPCDQTDVPKPAKKEIVTLTPEESKAFITASRTVGNGIIFEFALETGMRPEEYLALRWRDIDWTRSAIQIRQVVCENRTGGGFYFKSPKTAKSARQIPLSPELRSLLLDHKRTQNEQRLASKVAYEPLDLVFATQIGTPLQLKNIRTRVFLPILEAIGIIEKIEDGGKLKKIKQKNVTLYSLRHTCATLLLMAGENPKVVAERLGHASVVLTLDTYSHVVPTMQEKATERLNNILRF